MNNRISGLQGDREKRRERQSADELLAAILAQYQARFPEIRIVVLETPADAI